MSFSGGSCCEPGAWNQRIRTTCSEIFLKIRSRRGVMLTWLGERWEQKLHAKIEVHWKMLQILICQNLTFVFNSLLWLNYSEVCRYCSQFFLFFLTVQIGRSLRGSIYAKRSWSICRHLRAYRKIQFSIWYLGKHVGNFIEEQRIESKNFLYVLLLSAIFYLLITFAQIEGNWKYYSHKN